MILRIPLPVWFWARWSRRNLHMVWKVKQQPCLYLEGHYKVRCCCCLCTLSLICWLISSAWHGSWLCSNSCWILLFLQLLDKVHVSSMAEGASLSYRSPASSELEGWRWLEISAGFTVSSWAPGCPCSLSQHVCISQDSIREIAPVGSTQGKLLQEICSHWKLATQVHSLSGKPSGRAGWALSGRRWSFHPKVKFHLLGSLTSAFQLIEPRSPKLSRIISST